MKKIAFSLAVSLALSLPLAAQKAPATPPGMTFATNWLATQLITRRELLECLDLYSKAAAGGKTDPVTIWGPVKWLMPVQEAIKALPKGVRKQREFRVTNLAFPQNSLMVTIMAITGSEFVDGGEKFNLIYFISDAKQQVISVQLVQTNPKIVLWQPRPEGVREPYYNFIDDKWNGSTRQCVPFQTKTTSDGVTLIKTALLKLPNLPQPPTGAAPPPNFYAFIPYLESVHWYLPAPFAAKFQEIVEHNRKSGVP
ncbi:hypothetical protein [Roseimicrobium sp. ORNL1]|uniref:hypothetical protein n=1 Tax=Roseimicrobium sp. ORNL1 TaxID=2711231 RepID=UPI0013E1EF5E|nr:hypothetical protein [Roseimicrobium sp. ORNL1]QIF00208.1 hypothetical protein G5S37_01275 [Roseimicrobium sp. ORNL1]